MTSKPKPMAMSYWRFAAMIATSTIVMYGRMYLNTYAREHVYFSETRLWMALVMGGTMSVIMLGFMWGMYADRRLNIAILTSERAQISDPRVRRLADEIIEAQEREIAEMKFLAADLARRD